MMAGAPPPRQSALCVIADLGLRGDRHNSIDTQLWVWLGARTSVRGPGYHRVGMM